MVFDITQIKKIRKQLNLTQKEFALKAGISQSMVAKVESGRLDPTYSKVKQIENALEQLSNQHEKQAHDIMVKNIFSASPEIGVLKIIDVMQKKAISQLPIIEKERIVGIVTETSILSKNLQDIKNLLAKDIMDEPPPIISKNTRLEVITQLLRFYSCILVKERGKLIGLITRSDLVKSLVR